MTIANVDATAFRAAVDDVILHGSIALDLLTESGAMQGTTMSERNERVNKAIRDLERSLDTMRALQSGRFHA